MIKIFILLAVVIILVAGTNIITCRDIRSGKWSDRTTWQNYIVPDQSSFVDIKNCNITIDSSDQITVENIVTHNSCLDITGNLTVNLYCQNTGLINIRSSANLNTSYLSNSGIINTNGKLTIGLIYDNNLGQIIVWTNSVLKFDVNLSRSNFVFGWVTLIGGTIDCDGPIYLTKSDSLTITNQSVISGGLIIDNSSINFDGILTTLSYTQTAGTFTIVSNNALLVSNQIIINTSLNINEYHQSNFTQTFITSINPISCNFTNIKNNIYQDKLIDVKVYVTKYNASLTVRKKYNSDALEAVEAMLIFWLGLFIVGFIVTMILFAKVNNKWCFRQTF